MNRAIAMFVLLCFAAPSWAEPVLTAAVKGCTRAGLQKVTQKYVAALKKGDPSLMPLAPQAKYIERRKEIPLGQGLWQKPFPVDFSRSYFDVEICESFTEIIQAKSDHPYVVGTRLKVVDGKIAEIESLASDKRDWLFNADNYLKYSSTEKWDIIPPEKRSDRQSLIKVASDYFDIFQDYSSFDKVPWGIPCVRIEGGMYTNSDNHPNPSCTEGVPKGGGVPMTNRRYIVDVDMGTVTGQIDFGGEKGLPDAHTFRLENGKLRYVHVITLCPNGCPVIPPPKDMPKTQPK
ncbi:MAG TPA: hypothetical protein VMG30_12900 [Acidobacteriota bacterium]|nr:hypothetical protein [Acidobacteriota bacterium]